MLLLSKNYINVALLFFLLIQASALACLASTASKVVFLKVIGNLNRWKYVVNKAFCVKFRKLCVPSHQRTQDFLLKRNQLAFFNPALACGCICTASSEQVFLGAHPEQPALKVLLCTHLKERFM